MTKKEIWDELDLAPKIEQFKIDGSYGDDIFIAVTNLASHIRFNNQFYGNSNMQDAQQDAVERVFKKIHLIDTTKGKTYSYVYRIIYFVYLGIIRERKRKNKYVSHYDYLDYIGYGVEEEKIDWDLIWDRTKKVIKKEPITVRRNRALEQLEKMKDIMLKHEKLDGDNTTLIRKIMRENMSDIWYGKLTI